MVWWQRPGADCSVYPSRPLAASILQKPGALITIDLDKRRLHFCSPNHKTKLILLHWQSSYSHAIRQLTIVSKALNPGGPFGVR